MLPRFLIICIIISNILSVPLVAQDDPLLPSDLEPIRLENVDRLTEFGVVGRGRIDQISLSPEGSHLAVINRLGIHIHDLNQIDVSPVTIAAEYAPIINARFDPAWSRVAISTPLTLTLLDVKTGSVIQELSQMNGSVHATANEMIFSSDGRWLAITMGLDSGTAKVWNTQTGDLVYNEDHRYPPRNPIFGPDNQTFAYVYSEPCFIDCADPAYFVWYWIDTQTWDFWAALDGETTFAGFESGQFDSDSSLRGPFVTSMPRIITSPDGHTLVSQKRDGETRIWDALEGVERLILPSHYKFEGFSPDHRLLVSNDSEHHLCLFDLSTSECKTVTFAESNVLTAFDDSGETLALADSSGHIRIINVDTGDEIQGISTSYLGTITTQVFDEDSSGLYFMDNRVNFRYLDMATGQVTLLVHDENAAGNFAYDPVARLAALGMLDGSIQLWNVDSLEQHTLLGHDARITDVVFNPYDGSLASSSFDHSVRLWDIASGESIIFARYDRQAVDALAFSPDGTRLLVVDGDNGLGAVLYDMQTNAEIASIPVSGVWSIHAASSPEQDWMAASGFQINLWQKDQMMPALTIPSGTVNAMAFNRAGDLLLHPTRICTLAFRMWYPYGIPQPQNQLLNFRTILRLSVP